MTPYPAHLTHDELERWAYANGDTQTAALAAAAADLELQLEQKDDR